MKKKSVVASSALVLASIFAVASPATAAPVAGDVFAAIGGNNYIGVSADGSVVATYSEYVGLTVLDVASGTTTDYTDSSLGLNDAGDVAVSPDGSLIYIMDWSGQQVVVLNSADGTQDRTISLSFAPWMSQISSDGAYLFVYAYSSGDFVRIDLSNDSVSTSMALDSSFPGQLCMTSDNSTLFVPQFDSGTIAVIDVATFVQTDSLTDSDGPYLCSLGPDDALYVGDGNSGQVRKFASDGTSITSTYSAGSLYAMGTTCANVVVGDYNQTAYTILDPDTLEVVDTLSTTVYPYAMEQSASGDVWAGGYSAAEGLQSVTESNCPTPTPDPELPNTGVDTQALTTAAGLALAFLTIGAMLLVARRRRE